MSTFSGKPVTVNLPAKAISDKFADLTVFAGRLDNIPQEHRARMGEMSFEKDSITMRNPQVGAISFRVVERTPSRVALQCDSPLPIRLSINMTPQDEEDTTVVTTDVDVELPAMLKPFIGPHMQKVADEFGQMMGSLARS